MKSLLKNKVWTLAAIDDSNAMIKPIAELDRKRREPGPSSWEKVRTSRVSNVETGREPRIGFDICIRRVFPFENINGWKRGNFLWLCFACWLDVCYRVAHLAWSLFGDFEAERIPPPKVSCGPWKIIRDPRPHEFDRHGWSGDRGWSTMVVHSKGLILELQETSSFFAVLTFSWIFSATGRKLCHCPECIGFYQNNRSRRMLKFPWLAEVKWQPLNRPSPPVLRWWGFGGGIEAWGRTCWQGLLISR